MHDETDPGPATDAMETQSDQQTDTPPSEIGDDDGTLDDADMFLFDIGVDFAVEQVTVGDRDSAGVKIVSRDPSLPFAGIVVYADKAATVVRYFDHGGRPHVHEYTKIDEPGESA